MNRANIVESLATSLNLPKSTCAAIAEHLFDAETGLFATELKNGGEVHLQGFGSFRVVTRKARVATSPATGARINVPEKKAVKFKPGKTISSLL